MTRFGPDTLISDVLQGQPGAAAVFQRYGLGCPGCFAASMETVSAVASMHDVSVELLLEDINRLDAPTEEEQR